MRILAAISVFIMLFKPVFPLVDYAANYDYISKVLCINKEKPQLACNGKCHLMKELAKAAETEKPSAPNGKKHQTETELFCDTCTRIDIEASFTATTAQLPSEYSNLYSILQVCLIFRPPAIV